MKNSGKKLNKKYIISLIAVICIYILCLRLGIIEPESQQSSNDVASTESMQEEQSENIESIADELEESVAPTQEGTEVETESKQDESAEANNSSEEIVATDYEFRSKKLQDSHYEKHGIEMGFATVEDYVEAANMVIANPEALHKLEEEDNDHVYFLEETNEFVILSQDGYIRTYYIADGGLDYFNRQ